MITLYTQPLFLEKRPQDDSTVELVRQMGLSLSPEYRPLKECIHGDEDRDLERKIIQGNIFTIELYGVVFTFKSRNNFFTLKEMYECIHTAWYAPFSPEQLEAFLKEWDEEIIGEIEGSVLSLNKIFPYTCMNGINWHNGKYVPEEMQD